MCSLTTLYIFQNILCKTTFPRNFEVKEISENGLEAKVTAKSNGLGKVSVIYNKKRQIMIEFQFEILGKVHIFMRMYCFIGDTTLRNFYIMTLVIKKKN